MSDSDPVYATFWDHIEQLRRTLIAILVVIGLGVALSLCCYESILALLTAPLNGIDPQPVLVILGPVEGFAIAVKTCFWFSFAATSPLWTFMLLRFLAPALHRHERQLIAPFLLLSALFLSLGIAMAYYVTIPLANRYLWAFNGAIGQNMWSLTHYLDYTVLLILANAVSFELTVLFFFLVHLGWLSAQWLCEKRRIMIVAIFIVSALLTPPDILTQLLMAFPLIGLYELLILYARWRERYLV